MIKASSPTFIDDEAFAFENHFFAGSLPSGVFTQKLTKV